jgi:putative spermidine/putrescine transport system substrate-binding protein
LISQQYQWRSHAIDEGSLTPDRTGPARKSRVGSGGSCEEETLMAHRFRYLAVGGACVGLAVAMSACGSSSGGSGSASQTLTVFSQGDVNVQNLWNKVLIPGFEKAFPGDKIKLVYTTESSQNTTVYDQIAASVKAHKTATFDLTDGSVPAQLATAKIATKVTSQDVPNISRVDPTAFVPVNNEAVPLRGSEVLLAYNSATVPNPPTTLAGLISWIKAHPGKFSYCNPSDGGSGSGFVQGILSSQMPASDVQKLVLGYSPSTEAGWNSGFTLLKSLAPDMFNKQYATSNQAVVTLLGSGSIDMAPVWSDEATTALKDGQLPKSVKLVGLTPALPGGPDYLGVPENASAAGKKLAFKFMNWALETKQQESIISAMNGTPAIKFSYLPASVAAQFASFSATPAEPYSAQSGSDMEKQWSSKVG